MRVIIAGPRDVDGVEFSDMPMLESVMEAAAVKGIVPTEVVCGMARGVDLLGKAWAEARGIPVKEMPANWNNPDGSTNRGAGYARNRDMADYAEALVAIYKDSKGTANMIELAHQKKLEVHVHRLFDPATSGQQSTDNQPTIQEESTESGQDPAKGGHPQVVNMTRRHHGVLYVAGEGPKPSEIMFLATALLEEEAEESQQLNVSGQKLTSKPRYLKGASGSILKDLLLGVGIDIKECYYTALYKWLLPLQTRLKPPKAECDKALPALLAEIKEVQPKIIVCFGKPAFDALVPYKISLSDAKGAWFTSDKAPGAKIYVLEDPTKLLTKAEYVEKFRGDFMEVARLRDDLHGVTIPQVPLNYSVIHNFSELCSWIAKMKEEQWKLFSVDCEWGGWNFVDGRLRSVQFCWAPGQAVYIRFRAPDATGEADEYTFDVPYSVAGAALGTLLNAPDVFMLGHFASADGPWLHHWLGIEYWDKFVLDTAFAYQCVNEHESMGLERLALKFTPFGRYDIDLIIWKKANPGKVSHENGYALVPDEIIIPYAMKDVDAPMRAYGPLVQMLKDEDMWVYYSTIFGPFVTSCFIDMTIQGLIIDRQRLDDLRELYNWATDELTKDFTALVMEESKQLLLHYLGSISNGDMFGAFAVFQEALSENRDGAWAKIKDMVPAGGMKKAEAIWQHFLESPRFNIRSHTMMSRWLYDVKGLTPVKSIGNREKGIPAVDWNKVLTYPEAKQKEFKPAVDKQTLQILGEQDATIMKLLDLNACGNIRKGFLKPAEVDPDSGELVKENGLHAWIASDGKLHNSYSATETGRPKSFSPNVLVFPSWVNEKIERSVKGLVEDRHAKGELPEAFKRYLTDKLPSIRSVVTAGEGYVFGEDDYKTAELVSWAVISGDEAFMSLFTDPDKEFCMANISGEDKAKPVRLCYNTDSPVSEDQRNPAFIMAWVVEGEIKARVTEADLLRKEDGSLMYAAHDLHWGLAEMYQHRPREVMSDKKHRGAAKAGNFGCAFGTTADTLERKIEADTGEKPEPGTGQAILDALEKRQSKAFRFMAGQEELPANPGYYRCKSGRVRHFVKDLMYLASLDYRSRKSLLSRLGREARNMPCQESVGATAARAFVNMQRYLRSNGFESRVGICLYDSLVVRMPLHERFEVQKLQKYFMSDSNTWDYDGRELKLYIDEELNLAWSEKPTKEQTKLLWDKTWRVNKPCREPAK